MRDKTTTKPTVLQLTLDRREKEFSLDLFTVASLKHDSQIECYEASGLVGDWQEPNQQDCHRANGNGEHGKGDAVMISVSKVQTGRNEEENDSSAGRVV